MEPESIHELTAAYALDALDEREGHEYEEHLARCPRCREELAALSGVAESLAYGVESPPPPAGLRERILEEAARSDGAKVVPLRRRWPASARAAVAVAAAAAVGLGVWSIISGSSGSSGNPVAVPVSSAHGRTGSLVVAPDDKAVLVLSDVRRAPAGKTYEVWVVQSGKATQAGLFSGGAHVALRMTRPVPRGAQVAVTVERAGGVSAPTTRPVFHAQT